MPKQSQVTRLFSTPPQGRWPTPREIEQEIRRREPEMMGLAKQARKNAHSYRSSPVLIGCAVLACRPGLTHEERFGVFVGWNFTPAPRALNDPTPKPCAERMAINRAFEAGFSQIVYVVIFTPHNQRDDISGVMLRSMPPCQPCSEFMWPIVAGWVKILSFRPRTADDPPGDEYVKVIIAYDTLICLHRSRSG